MGPVNSARDPPKNIGHARRYPNIHLVWNWILTNTANSNNNRNLVKMMDEEPITSNHKCFPYANNSKTPTKKKIK